MAQQPRSGDMPRERDESSGKYRTTYSAERILDALETLGDRVPTPEITAELGCSDRIARDRLKELADEGRVERQKVGNVYLWSLTEGENQEDSA